MLANFVTEFTSSLRASVGICQVTIEQWQVYMDNESNVRGSGVRIVMVSPKGLRLEKSLRLGFRALNNEVEYEALIARLWVVQRLGAEEVEVFSDSRLVVSQIEGRFEARDNRMSQYLKLFGSLWVNFQKVSVGKVPRS